MIARAYRLWMERSAETGKPSRCGVRPLTKKDEREYSSTMWEQLANGPTSFSFEGPWQVLLRLLNMERRIPDVRFYKALISAPDWDTWKEFGRELGVPYFLTSNRGHPFVWFPATDGRYYGILLKFGNIPGQWNWWVPGTERYEIDPKTGDTLVIMGETHPEAPAGKTIRELMESAPKDLFNVNVDEQLSLPEVLEIELHKYTQQEIDRCRFSVFHEESHDSDESYPLKTVDTVRQFICSLAWTWLSPHIEFWDPFIRVELGKEVGGDPNIVKEETGNKLRNMEPGVRFAKSVSSMCCYGRNPLAFLLSELDKTAGFAPAVADRVRPSLTQKARDSYWMSGEDQEAKEERRKQTEEARRQLTGSIQLREELTTTNVFAVASQQLMWSVEAGLKVRACPHPGCGEAFLLFPGDRYRYCPKHRDEAARSSRHRMKDGMRKQG